MIEQDAKVVRIIGDQVEVETLRQSACGSCSASKGCGTSMLADWFPKRRLLMRLPNRVDACQGDRVVIGLDEGALQRATYKLYGLPLLALLVGAIAGERLAGLIGLSTELAAITFGLLGMIAVLLLLRANAASAGHGVDYEIRLLRVAGRTQTILPQSLLAAADEHSQGAGTTQ